MTIRQFKLANSIYRYPPTPQDALKFNQCTFGSLCKNKTVIFDAYQGKFVLSEVGADLIKHFNAITLIYRKHNTGRFSINVPRGATKLRSIA